MTFSAKNRATVRPIELLGTLLGFGTSVVPKLLGYLKRNQANKQELAMIEAKAKYAHDHSLDSGGFVNVLRGSVLPVITYLFFLLFAANKGSIVYAMIAH